MARLSAPNGATVNVSDEKAKRLLTQGYTAVETKSPAKKTATKKTSSSKSEK